MLVESMNICKGDMILEDEEFFNFTDLIENISVIPTLES